MDIFMAILTALSNLSHNFSSKLTKNPKFKWVNWVYYLVILIVAIAIAIINPDYFLK